MNDDVTVVIACFNYGRFLGEAVESASSQGARAVVVDDGSTDPDTGRVLAALEGEGVEVVRQDNRGVCLARNAGLERVQTPFAVVLDADDRLAPGSLDAMRAALERDPSLGYAYGRMRLFGAWQGELRFPDYSAYRLLHRHTIGLSALMRRDVWEETGGFDPEFEAYEDWELWLHALAHGWRGRRVEAVTLEYRRHAGTSKVGRDRRSYWHVYEALRMKHGSLYARERELAAEERIGRLERGVYRWFWGRRPVPVALEALLHRRVFGRGSGAGG